MKFSRRHYRPQVDMRDCGVAVFAMIFNYYGSFLSLATLREKAGTTLEGTTALGLVRLAETMGFATQALQADMSLFDMNDLAYPFVVHVLKKDGLSHYYLVTGVDNDFVHIADPDPMVQLTKLKRKEFEEEWTGVTIFLKPTVFYKQKQERQHRFLDYFSLLVMKKRLIMTIFVIGLCVVFIHVLATYYLQKMVDVYIPQGSQVILSLFSIGLIFSYGIQQMLSYVQDYLILILNRELSYDIVLPYIRHIFKLPLRFFATRRTGEILSRFTDANHIIEALTSCTVSLFLDCSICLMVSFILFFKNGSLFLLTLLLFPIYVLIAFLFLKPFDKVNNEVMKASGLVTSSIIENIKGIETLKSLTGEKRNYQEIHKKFTIYLQKFFRYSQLSILQKGLKELSQLLLNVLILWFGAHLVMRQELSLGELITYTSLVSYFTKPLENIIHLQTKLQAAQVATNRLSEVYLVNSEFEASQTSQDTESLTGDLSIQNVTYQYGYGDPVLENIHLNIKAKSKISFVGSSGSGKTTLAKLLVGFYQDYQGNISLGQKNIQQIDKQLLRSSIHYVPQQSCFFEGSILENLLLGSSGSIQQEQIFWAIKMAELEEDIKRLPEGYHTKISTDSINLSGGQKQKIAIARALLTNARILILDETTSGLDSITEKKIIQNLLTLDKTVIFITHRLVVAERSEQVVVFDRGRIVERGTHKDLVNNRSFYHEMIECHR